MRAAALALVIFAFESGQEMTTAQQSGFQFVGETVTVSFVADLSVGHGQFRLENHGTDAMTAAVISAWVLTLRRFMQYEKD